MHVPGIGVGLGVRFQKSEFRAVEFRMWGMGLEIGISESRPDWGGFVLRFQEA